MGVSINTSIYGMVKLSAQMGIEPRSFRLRAVYSTSRPKRQLLNARFCKVISNAHTNTFSKLQFLATLDRLFLQYICSLAYETTQLLQVSLFPRKAWSDYLMVQQLKPK